MDNTVQHSGKIKYSAKPSLWSGYISFTTYLVGHDLEWGREFICSDSLVDEINIAVAEAEDPNNHTTYNTVEQFLDSLRKR